MKKLEKIFVVLTLLGLIGNLFRINYSNHVFMIGCTLLSIIYFFFSFALFNDVRLRKITKSGSFKSVGRIIGAIGTGIALSIIIIGIQFKFLILEGSHEMLIIGTTLLTIISFVALLIFLIRHKGKSEFYKGAFKRIIPVLIIGIFSYMLPTTDLVDIRYRDNPKLAELIKKSLKDPYNEHLREQIREERQKEK